MTYRATERAVSAAGLIVMGALTPEAGGTLILIGAGPEFWPVFRASPEFRDGEPDPIDRWSARVIGGLADALGADARYPFGGPPHQPFVRWAIESGRAWQSPTGMLVHDRVGLMISYRGALHFADRLALPAAPAASPCDGCPGKPCLTACPVDALGAGHGYDVAACHGFLDTIAGRDCMGLGCAVRRACPVSVGAGRQPEQSALHMRAFHPA